MYEEFHVKDKGGKYFKELEETTLGHVEDIPNLFIDEWMWFMLIQVYEEYMWMDKP